MSGETFRDGLQFLHQAKQLPVMFVFSDEDEYPPTQDAMKLLYITASSPSKRLVHYCSTEDAPWLWYEPFDLGKVPAHGGHGTDMFQVHPELPDIIVHWFVTTLIKDTQSWPGRYFGGGANTESASGSWRLCPSERRTDCGSSERSAGATLA